MPQSKEVHKEYMRLRRLKGSQSLERFTDHRTRHLAEALTDPVKRAKLTLISKALDKEVTGLDGQRVNIGCMVRYGIFGYTFKEIKELL